VWLTQALGRIGLGAIALILVDRRWALVLLGVIGLAVVGSVVRYLRFAYRIEGDALILEGGLVFTWRRVIPLPRIQSVDVVQQLRHRVFGVLELRIEAAGGKQTEAALVALTPEETQRLRDRLLAAAGAAPSPAEQTPILARLGPGLLTVAGVTGGRVAVIAVILGYAQEVLSERFVLELVERLGRAGAAGVIVLAVTVAAFLVVSLAISIVATILVYWDFTLRREGDRLVVTRGLLEKRRAVVPLRRLQAIKMDQNIVRLGLGLASLKAVSAGIAGRTEEEKETSVLLPIATRSQAVTIVAQLLGASAERLTSRLERPPVRALVRRVIWWSLPGIVAGLVGTLVLGPVGAFGFVLLPIGALFGMASWLALGHAIGDGLGVSRSGVLVRRTMFIPLRNLQHAALLAFPDQRLLDLGTVRLNVPGASAPLFDLARGRAEQRFDVLTEVMVGPQAAPAG
jgi:putative membrane protein